MWQTALRAADAKEAAAAEHVLQAFCRDNSEGQRMLAATLAPVGDTHADQSEGAAFLPCIFFRLHPTHVRYAGS